MVLPLWAILGASAIGAGANLLGAKMGADAAGNAADAQVEATEKQIDYLQGRDQQAREDALPWMEAGNTALQQYMSELGLGDPVEGATGFEKTPAYEFEQAEGQRSIVNNLAALGMRKSGSALKSLTQFSQGLANQHYGNYLNRLAGAAGMGQSQVNNTNALGAQTAGQVSNAIGNRGAAQASSYMGQANAWNTGLQGVSSNVGNALGMYAWSQRPNYGAL